MEDDIYDSKLGNLDYWDDFYNKEISNFELDPDFESQVWFGNQVQKKVIEFISNTFSEKELSIIDIGCGNAVFLIKLFQAGYTKLTGTDYSASSIILANKLINEKSKKHIGLDKSISLSVEDINNPIEPFNCFHILCDKGTFDAFLLLKENKSDKYIEYLYKKIHKNGGYFIITSCNNTRTELENYFANENITLVREIEHKKLTFGGSSGQTQTSLVFKIHNPKF